MIDSALVQREHAKHAADIRVLSSVDTRPDHKLCRMKLIQCPNGVWYTVNKSTQKRETAGRSPRLPVELSKEEFAKAVDNALRKLDDPEEAQRRSRTLPEECFRTDSKQTARRQWQKDNDDYLKQLSNSQTYRRKTARLSSSLQNES